MRWARARSAGGMAAMAAFRSAAPFPFGLRFSFRYAFIAAFSSSENPACLLAVLAGMGRTMACWRALSTSRHLGNPAVGKLPSSASGACWKRRTIYKQRAPSIGVLVCFTFACKAGKEAEFESLMNNPEGGKAVARAMGAARNTLFLGHGRMVRVFEFPDGAHPPRIIDLAKKDERL